MNWAAIVWFVLMVLFFIVEANTVSLVSIWFAVGSLVAFIVSLLEGPLWLQMGLFFVVTVALLLALRPISKKYFTAKLTKTNVDSVIGSTGMVTARIDNDQATGQVKLGGMEWSARSTSGQILEPGSKIVVDRIEGVKVFVSLAEVLVN